MGLQCDLEPRAVVRSLLSGLLSRLQKDVTHRSHSQHGSLWASAVGLPVTMHGPLCPKLQVLSSLPTTYWLPEIKVWGNSLTYRALN